MLDPVELFPEVPNLYEFPSVHADMVFDERRVRAYKRAIEETVRKGDVVVDVGAGTGLLTFLALQAGAERVHAIERSPVIKWARQLAAKNGYANRISFHHSDARNVNIDDKADVIISELIGHMAFEEGMVETIYDARVRFLKPNGILIPASVTLKGALVSECEIYHTYVNGWHNIWGIDYSIMREEAAKSAYIIDITERDLLSESKKVFTVDFSQGDPGVAQRTRSFKVLRPGVLNGVALWFDAQLSSAVRLSSSPWTKTHWKQCYVPLEEPKNVTAGENVTILFTLRFRTSPDDRFVFYVELLRGE